MLKKLITILAVNAFLILLFILGSYFIWYGVESPANVVQSVNIGPFWVTFHILGQLANGQIIPISLTPPAYFNFPFWLFFVSTAVNLFFIIPLLREKETEQRVT